ncbi:hypothetical protein ACKKBG_A08010 [Auxenochlorella protothecoides x Auxenochlorella symbiontica]
MAAATLAVIRAHAPTFRNRHDRLAFAVHAYLESRGYTLVSTGAEADQEAGPGSKFDSVGREPAPLSGWTDLEERYAFRYVNEQGAHLYLKAMVLGGNLVLQWQDGGQQPGSTPASLDLALDKYTRAAEGVSAGYSDLAGLVGALAAAGLGESAAQSASGQEAPAPGAQHGAAGRGDDDPTRGPRGGRGEAEPAYVRDAGGLRDPGYAVGDRDRYPLGLAPARGGAMPGLLPLMEGPPRRGGGMHVGPGDPLFDDRLGRGPAHGGPRPPPGARWDPIAPPGLPGFHPDGNLPRGPPGRGGIHPDIMQPGPGRGGTGADFGFM